MHGILIAPTAFREAGNALGASLGHGPDTYSVPLYPAATLSDEPTHYGACAPVTADAIPVAAMLWAWQWDNWTQDSVNDYQRGGMF